MYFYYCYHYYLYIKYFIKNIIYYIFNYQLLLLIIINNYIIFFYLIILTDQNCSRFDGRIIKGYRIERSLGKGTFGMVHIGKHLTTGEKIAVKILEKEKMKEAGDIERVTREIHILRRLRHPHIIQLFDIIETPKELFLVTELADGGELFDYIVKKQRLEEREACRIFQEMICGVEYLHQQCIVHRDLKPENLLLNQNQSIKIIDFGLSNTYRKGESLKTACGSPCYAAPEMIAGNKYEGLIVDIWSCGVILYAMLCGYLPFEDPDTTALYKKILKGDFEIPDFLSSQSVDFLKHILHTDPKQRFRIPQMRDHPWFKQVQEPLREPGITVGSTVVPINRIVLSYMIKYDIQIDYALKCLEANRHNEITATYYLLLNKFKRNEYLENQEESSKEADCKTIPVSDISKEREDSIKSDSKPGVEEKVEKKTMKYLLQETDGNPSSYKGTPKGNIKKRKSVPMTLVQHKILTQRQGRVYDNHSEYLTEIMGISEKAGSIHSIPYFAGKGAKKIESLHNSAITVLERNSIEKTLEEDSYELIDEKKGNERLQKLFDFYQRAGKQTKSKTKHLPPLLSVKKDCRNQSRYHPSRHQSEGLPPSLSIPRTNIQAQSPLRQIMNSPYVAPLDRYLRNGNNNKKRKEGTIPVNSSFVAYNTNRLHRLSEKNTSNACNISVIQAPGIHNIFANDEKSVHPRPPSSSSRKATQFRTHKCKNSIATKN